jgi:hypothetical protein
MARKAHKTSKKACKFGVAKRGPRKGQCLKHKRRAR